MKAFYIQRTLILSLLVMMLVNLRVDAQQEPMYTQYMFNTLNINPGYAGSRDAISVYLLSRSQWVGFDGAPSSQTMAIHSPFYSDKIGIGASFTYDVVGPVKSAYFNVNYAYRFRITETSRLSLGLKGGINNYTLGLTDLNLVDDSDQSFSSNTVRRFLPNVGIGVYFFSQKYYIGLSIPKLFETEISGENLQSLSVFQKERRHYFLISGYVFKLNDMFKLKPSILAKVVAGSPLSVDINANILYNEMFWFGLMYRVDDSVGALLQYRMSNNLSIGYSYDLPVSKLRSYNAGSHEIMISFDFETTRTKKNKKIMSPRYF